MSNINNSDFENMKESFECAKSTINENLKYSIIEDTENRRYVLIDLTQENSEPDFLPFGVYFASVANQFIDSNEKSIYHKTFLERCVMKDRMEKMQKCQKALTELLSLIRDANFMRSKRNEDVPLKVSLLHEWKKYRYLSIPEVYSNIYSYLEGYSDDFKQRAEELGELDNILSLESRRTEFFWDALDQVHRIIKKRFFIPYDVVCIFNKGEWITGQAWFCTYNTDYIFSRELYHLLVDNLVEAPRFCPRCNHLFYSNNKKAKYCPNCKENYKEIRNNARKANEVGYLHKRIYDKISSTKRYDRNDLDKFVVESNFYRDIVRGKEPATPIEPWYDLNITTKEQYQAWLEKKLEEYSYRKKK